MSGSAPIIVTARFGRHDQAWFNALRREHYPPERNVLDAHLTLFHHLPPSVLEELKNRLQHETRAIAAPHSRVTGLMHLGRGVAYRIESPELTAIRERLSAAFAPLLMPQDAGNWRPHVTIQNKVSPSLAKFLLGALSRNFTPRSVEITGLSTWFYRGGPWEVISHHNFR